MGKILRVNLTTGTISAEPINEEIARKYIGGKGYAVKILYDIAKSYEEKGIDLRDLNPLGPENVLILATGPATGFQKSHHLEDTTSWP